MVCLSAFIEIAVKEIIMIWKLLHVQHSTSEILVDEIKTEVSWEGILVDEIKKVVSWYACR